MQLQRDKDRVIKFFLDFALKYFNPKKIILFGSRARGDNSQRSDYDFAVDDSGIPNDKWVRFSVDLRENLPTLNEVEVVRISQVAKPFKKRILEEGIVLYESKNKFKKSR